MSVRVFCNNSILDKTISQQHSKYWALDAGYTATLTLLTFVENRIAAMVYAFFINVLKLLPTPFVCAFLSHVFHVKCSRTIRAGCRHDAYIGSLWTWGSEVICCDFYSVWSVIYASV